LRSGYSHPTPSDDW